MSHFLERKLRHGPFIFLLTDIHQSNTFLDEDWHIQYLIDLEWACSLPKEMLQPPYWGTSRGNDQLAGEHLIEYNKIREELMEAFEGERSTSQWGKPKDLLELTPTMKRTWHTGCFFLSFKLWRAHQAYSIFSSSTSSQDTRRRKSLAPHWTNHHRRSGEKMRRMS